MSSARLHSPTSALYGWSNRLRRHFACPATAARCSSHTPMASGSRRLSPASDSSLRARASQAGAHSLKRSNSRCAGTFRRDSGLVRPPAGQPATAIQSFSSFARSLETSFHPFRRPTYLPGTCSWLLQTSFHPFRRACRPFTLATQLANPPSRLLERSSRLLERSSDLLEHSSQPFERRTQRIETYSQLLGFPSRRMECRFIQTRVGVICLDFPLKTSGEALKTLNRAGAALFEEAATPSLPSSSCRLG